METIILSIQRQLTRKVPGLNYIDRDWGQLLLDNPPLKYPSALIDLQSVEYETFQRGNQRARATFAVTICNSRITPTSSRSPRKEDAYLIFRIMREVHYALHMFTNEGNFTPLMRVSIQKNEVSPAAESYTIYYRTTFDITYENQNG